jgi:hypothetical protein
MIFSLLHVKKLIHFSKRSDFLYVRRRRRRRRWR